MISSKAIYARLPGWARHVEAGAVRLIAPEGELAGMISIEERVRSLACIADLIGDKRIVAGPTLTTNSEGEQGVLVTTDDLSESGWRYEIGMLVGDEFNAVVTGVTQDPAYFERTRQAVKTVVGDLPLLLGVRRRLFLYPPPLAWHGARRDLVTTWHPPGYPDDRARLIVHPALPRTSLPAEQLHQILRAEIGGTEEDVWTDEFVKTRFGLSFRVSSTTTSGVNVHLAIGEDHSYVYALRLEAAHADHVRALTATLDGIIPIDVRQAANPLDHWAA